MRIKLKAGKQKELILLAKFNLTWKELAKKLKLNEKYLYFELRNEMRLLPEIKYRELCLIAKVNFDNYIEEILEDNWGKSKGGKISNGSKIKLIKPALNEKLAEFIGAILGDGNINYYKKGKKIGVYHIRIAGDLEKDKDYHINYLKNLCENIFNLKAKEILRPNERFLDIYSKELVEFFIDMGLNAGDKIKNQITIPYWVWENESFLKACVRGLIDTDGSVFRMSNKDPKLIRLSFTNYNMKLLIDTRNAFIKLGFFPSKIIVNKQFFISRKSDISKYLKEINFSNLKHIERLKIIDSPMV